MFNLGPMEIALILVVALLIFGPSRLMELSKSVGKAIHEFRNSMEGKDSDEKPSPGADIKAVNEKDAGEKKDDEPPSSGNLAG
ncbi:MAG: twin-arginine translocase TatA/TatE family subunit [Chloroflexi bacterium]|nr:twin-arginine translocase TatA/TatE family subunit [Chloroflexota bacterium]